ncbi:gfo/Idh/MocA family oxidoreductase [Paludibacter sp. 221]|uniref:Gfo/Idh/MocA family protein n=1 Tax=Paludibacter sp. 221 TaxID=2302939 RepID=UPI0013D7A58E|nr:Gfo/Idh/MocA family oxidoreductase [Paludibacter sp. 221]NDV47390.1 gfo/Idh/MocA family oxidoreductase [Paludibacter sp. 221]
MKKLILPLVAACLLLVGCCKEQDHVIRTKVPVRPAGQTDVLQLRTDPIPTVRVAFIGLGMRGPGAVNRMTHIDGVEIVALCDVVESNVKKVNKKLIDKGLPAAQEFYGDTSVWRQVTKLPNVDLVYIATDWLHHAKIGIQALKDDKHVAIEVPSAMNMEEIWELINLSEQKRKHCLPLENCCYDFFELTTLNMVQQGVLGEVLHGEGAYIHGLQPYWNSYWKNDADSLGWRMDYNKKHRGDLYPTHGIGPVCQAMNIHRGDKMNFLVSVDTKAVGNPAFIKEKMGKEVTDFRNGDHTSTLIRTEKGKTILIEHDVTSPRPYSRMYQLTGTKGFANKYPVQGFALDAGSIDPAIAANHENLNAHSFVPNDVRKELMEKYKHPIVKDIEEKAKTVGGHGGMDFIMDYRLIYCLQRGLPLDMDVYDLAEWCCLIPLTELSLDNNSAPVEIPDFTRGAWDKLDKVTFAQ